MHSGTPDPIDFNGAVMQLSCTAGGCRFFMLRIWGGPGGWSPNILATRHDFMRSEYPLSILLSHFSFYLFPGKLGGRHDI